MATVSDVETAVAKAKEKMGLLETVFLSKSGQGCTTGINLLTGALSKMGKYFNVVINTPGLMRGGPVYHLLRVGNSPWLPKSPMTRVDQVVMFDETKFTVPQAWVEEFLLNFPTGLMIVNSRVPPEQWRNGYPFDGEAIRADVTEIAESMSDIRPAPIGVAVVAFYAGVNRLVPVELLCQKAEEYFTKRGQHARSRRPLAPANVDGIIAAYNLGMNAERVRIKGTGVREKRWTFNDMEELKRYHRIPAMPLPTYQSGQNETIWRTEVAIWVDSKCVRCAYCFGWLYCPDHCISITRPGSKGKAYNVVVDLGYCKGCGICEQVCPTAALVQKDAASVPGALIEPTS